MTISPSIHTDIDGTDMIVNQTSVEQLRSVGAVPSLVSIILDMIRATPAHNAELITIGRLLHEFGIDSSRFDQEVSKTRQTL